MPLNTNSVKSNANVFEVVDSRVLLGLALVGSSINASGEEMLKSALSKSDCITGPLWGICRLGCATRPQKPSQLCVTYDKRGCAKRAGTR